MKTCSREFALRLLVVSLTLTMMLPFPASRAADAQTRQVMQRIYENMRELLPVSVNAATFADDANQGLIRSSLNEIGANAVALEHHARDSRADAGTEFIALGLKRSITDALRSYEQRRLEETRSLVWNTTRLCAACHTRLPSADASEPRDFLDSSAFAALSPVERLQVQLATRQFDAALRGLETLLVSDALGPMDLMTPLTDYLIVNIRVKGDVRRPPPALAAFALRDDVWSALEADVQSWIVRLNQLAETGFPEPGLASARALLDSARTVAIVPYARNVLVDYILASALLESYIGLEKPQDADLAEAYYLLGLSEIGIGESYARDQGEHYLEASIFAAPQSDAAARAFALLEEQIIFSYSGSSGTHIPDDVREHLEALRVLTGS